MTHICVGNLVIISSDNGLSPGRRQAIIWTNDGILLIWTLRKKLFNRNLNIFIQDNAFENIVCEMMAILAWPQCVNTWTDVQDTNIDSLWLGDIYMYENWTFTDSSDGLSLCIPSHSWNQSWRIGNCSKSQWNLKQNTSNLFQWNAF